MSERKWKVFFYNQNGSHINTNKIAENKYDNDCNMINFVPRVGEYVVVEDRTADEDGKVYVVEKIFYNTIRRNVEVFLLETSKDRYFRP